MSVVRWRARGAMATGATWPETAAGGGGSGGRGDGGGGGGLALAAARRLGARQLFTQQLRPRRRVALGSLRACAPASISISMSRVRSSPGRAPRSASPRVCSAASAAAAARCCCALARDARHLIPQRRGRLLLARLLLRGRRRAEALAAWCIASSCWRCVSRAAVSPRARRLARLHLVRGVLRRRTSPRSSATATCSHMSSWAARSSRSRCTAATQVGWSSRRPRRAWPAAVRAAPRTSSRARSPRPRAAPTAAPGCPHAAAAARPGVVDTIGPPRASGVRWEREGGYRAEVGCAR